MAVGTLTILEALLWLGGTAYGVQWTSTPKPLVWDDGAFRP